LYALWFRVRRQLPAQPLAQNKEIFT
jgi:hypothetical protein